MLLVQQFTVVWTKASRGGSGARRRNTLPEAFALPSLQVSPSPTLLVHDKVHGQWFEPPNHNMTVEEYASGKNIYFGCITINPNDGHVLVTYSYNATYCGAPQRTAYPRQVLTLRLGTWGRIVYNGRFGDSWDGDWKYQKVVFNIGYFETFRKGCFLGTPDRTFKDIADLW